jgi:hypothetical protein
MMITKSPKEGKSPPREEQNAKTVYPDLLADHSDLCLYSPGHHTYSTA